MIGGGDGVAVLVVIVVVAGRNEAAEVLAV